MLSCAKEYWRDAPGVSGVEGMDTIAADHEVKIEVTEDLLWLWEEVSAVSGGTEKVGSWETKVGGEFTDAGGDA
jgi:hypothetical protein